jgi:hypothetical protein
VEHVHGFLEFLDVEDAMLDARVNADFDDACADRAHGLPIARHEALLYSAELVPGAPASVLGKRAEFLERRTEPGQR